MNLYKPLRWQWIRQHENSLWNCLKIDIIKKVQTLSWWYQNIDTGGSGLNRMAHVKLMVLPLSTYRSGPFNIVAVGTGKFL